MDSSPSGRAVAAAASVPISTAHRALAGRNVGVVVALKIARAMGQTVEQLFGHLAPPIEPLPQASTQASKRGRSPRPDAPTEEALDPVVEEAVARFRAEVEAMRRPRPKAKRTRAPKTVKAGARATRSAA